MRRFFYFCFLIVVLSVLLYACDNKNTDSTQLPTEVSVEETEAETVKPSINTNSNKKVVPTEGLGSASNSADTDKKPRFKDISDYIEDSGIKSDINNLNASLSDVKVTLAYSGSDTLIYKYAYKTYYTDEQLNSMSDSLKSYLDSRDESMEEVKKDIKQYSDVENPVIKMVFYSMDGSVIAEKTW